MINSCHWYRILVRTQKAQTTPKEVDNWTRLKLKTFAHEKTVLRK